MHTYNVISITLILLVISSLSYKLYCRFQPARAQLQPIRLLVIGYIVTILIGTGLLLMPIASLQPLTYTDALFTATSAVCVTGLSVVQIDTQLSPVGQGIIALLVQLGGLGIMTFSALLAIMTKQKLSHKNFYFFQSGIDKQSQAHILPIILSIFKATLLIELLGASLLALCFYTKGMPGVASIGYGLFHAITAFCNAGFALFPDSFAQFESHPAVLLTLGGLIVLGGLGFSVLYNIAYYASQNTRLTPYAKLVLWTTLVLTVLSTVIIALSEWHTAFNHLSRLDTVVNALFYAVSARTAGFATGDLLLFNPATLLIIIGLMYIGTAPGSTGGGIRITTFFVMLGTLRQVIRGHETMTFFGRRVDTKTYQQALSIAVLSVLIIGTATILVIRLESASLLHTLFEVVSAFSTTGLSLGLTPILSVYAKYLIIGLMIMGRIGALTFIIALSARGKTTTLHYPKASIPVA